LRKGGRPRARVNLAGARVDWLQLRSWLQPEAAEKGLPLSWLALPREAVATDSNLMILTPVEQAGMIAKVT
jgi:hypothetical protein